MRQRIPWMTVLLLSGIGTAALSAAEANLDPVLAKIKAVGKEGKGNAPAGQAWREIVGRGVDALIPVLSAIDDSDPTTANWLRTAADAIAEKALAGNQLFATSLEKFIADKRRAGSARRIAYEWLSKVDPSAPARLLPGFLNDPSRELRRDAVDVVLKEAQKNYEQATQGYRKALASARDKDQVELIAKQLKGLGVDVNLANQFGFVQTWRVIGPFDNPKNAGFATVYPPEKGVHLDQTYKGKKDAACEWLDHTTTDPYGTVDFNKVIGKHMGVTGYAYTVVNSVEEKPVQLRACCNSAIKIFLNGKEVFFRDEYHHGFRMDQHLAPVTLKRGRNEILVKVCQNEQQDPWAQKWDFQLRICDALGGAVPVTVALEKAAPPAKTGKEKS